MSARSSQKLTHAGISLKSAKGELNKNADKVDQSAKIANKAGSMFGKLSGFASTVGLDGVASALNDASEVSNAVGNTMESVADVIDAAGDIAGGIGVIVSDIADLIGPDGKPIPKRNEYKVKQINEYIPVDGFTLPEGYTWNIEEGRQPVEGVVTVMDNFNSGNMLLLYKDRKLNGESRFYMFGRLIETRTYVNDVAEGWACVYGRYKPNQYFIYEKGVKKYQAFPLNELKEGYWKVIDIDSGLIVWLCMYDENHQQYGPRYLYENGVIQKVVDYNDNGEEIILKEFEEEEMREYSREGEIVYIGGYSEYTKRDNGQLDYDYDYPRHGEGYDFVDNTLFYVGKWNRNKREGEGRCMINAFAAYDGYWENGFPNGNGAFVRNDKIIYEGEWKNGCLAIPQGQLCALTGTLVSGLVINDGNNLVSILKHDKNRAAFNALTITDNSCNDLTHDVVLTTFMSLEILIINQGALKNIPSLIICDNCQLKEIRIGSWNGEDNETCSCRNVKRLVLKGNRVVLL